MNKKAQTEIIGLAILVILLVIILVIALSFSFKFSTGEDSIKTSITANNLLNALIKQEGKISIKELVHECYINTNKGLPADSGCIKLTNELDQAIKYNIGNKDFEIRFSTDNSIFYKQGSCKTGVESTKYNFKAEEILFTTSMKIC